MNHSNLLNIDKNDTDEIITGENLIPKSNFFLINEIMFPGPSLVIGLF